MDMNVFIVDDDKSVTTELSEIIRNWAILNNYQINTVIKNDLKEVSPDMVSPFDLIILDIRIGNSDGIDFAKALRNIGSDATIAFISNYEQYAINGYSVHAVSYLLKPIHAESIESLMVETASRIGNITSRSIHLIQNGKDLFIACDSILYIEAFSNRIVVHLKDKEQSFYSSMNELESQLSRTSLVRCHRSFIINLEYVQDISFNQVHLFNVSVPIPLSRSYASAVKEQLFQKRRINT